MAEFRFTTTADVEAAALADTAAATATVAGFRQAVADLAVEQMAAHPDLALLAAQRRVSSRWSILAANLTGSPMVKATVDVRLLNLPEVLIGADVAVLVEFVQALVGGTIAWLASDDGDAMNTLASNGVEFADEFLASVAVAQA